MDLLIILSVCIVFTTITYKAGIEVLSLFKHSSHSNKYKGPELRGRGWKVRKKR